MNEKIRRLMEKAVIAIDGHTFGKTYIPDEFTEKFARLLILECADIASDDWDTAGRAILKHFGVER
jgi:hypothetical protein